MKQNILKKLMLIAVLLTGLQAFAHDFEVDGIYYNILSKEDKTVEVTYGDTKYSGAVIIPESVNHNNQNYSVKNIGFNTFNNCNGLTEITIPNSVTNISDQAFYACYALTDITIPNTVTCIERYAFAYCSSLSSVRIPDSVTSIGECVFMDCESLNELVIGNSLTNISRMAFSDCSELSSVTLGNSIISIGESAFNGCVSLTSITLPNSVTSIEQCAFYGCSLLLSITLPTSVVNIGDMAFWGCTELQSITLPKTLTNLGESVFNGCNGLTSISIPKSLNTIKKGTFRYCRNLSSVLLPNTITSIGVSAFEGCGNLTSITIPNSVINIGNSAFNNCYNLTSIIIPCNVTKIGNKSFENCSKLANITLGNSLSEIGVYTFRGCGTITKVESLNPTAPTITETVFPTTVYENAQLVIPPTKALDSYKNATGWSKFANINEGYKVTAVYSTTGGTVAINNALQNPIAVDIASKVDFLITPNEGFEIEKVTLNDVDITENIVDGKYSIERISENLTFAVTFKKLYTITANFISEEGVVTINGQEENPIQVSFDTKVDFAITPNEGYEIDKVLLNDVDVTADVVDGKYSIEKASEDVMLNVTFKKPEILNKETFEVDGIYYKVLSHEDKTVEVTFKGNTFMEYDNEYVGEIIIPETVNFVNTTYSVTSIGNGAFADCSSLTSVTIPNSITSIGNYAFDNCNLTSIIIPKSVISIGTSIFRSCMTLNSIVVDEENINYDSRDNCNSIIETETNTLISGCKNSVIPNSVTRIGDQAFYGCKGLISISIPNTVITIGNSAFAYCNGLASITIPNSIETIGDYAFLYCNLTSVSIGSKVLNIGKFAFNYCNLTTLIIPNSVTKIDNSAFAGNSRLATVTIGENVDTIGDKAFHNCYISSIYCKAIIPPVATSEKDNATFIENVMLSATLYVPTGSKEAYANATGWKDFLNITEFETEVDITIMDASNQGSTSFKYEIGKSFEFRVTPAVGYIVNTVVVNGEEISSDNGDYKIESVNEETTISVSYEIDPATGVNTINANNLKVYGYNETLTVTGTEYGDTISIYDLNGAMLKTQNSVGSTNNISLDNGIYIVKVNGKSFKVML